MTEHRREGGVAHAHILVVDEIEIPTDGAARLTPYGVMYDFRAGDLNGIPREGCAIAMDQIDGQEPPKPPRNVAYWRTLAHELGHCFNLVHPDRVGTTLMNTTEDMEESDKYPDDISFSYSDSDQTWLRTAPSRDVLPGGGGRFRGEDEGTFDARKKTAALALEVRAQRGSYQIGDPIYLNLKLRNVGKAPIEIVPSLSVASGTLGVAVTTPRGVTSRFAAPFALCGAGRRAMLNVGEELVHSEPIFLGRRGRTFKATGVYKIQARYRVRVGGEWVTQAAKCEVQLEKARSTVAQEVLSRSNSAMYLYLRGGRHLGVEDDIRRVIDDTPNGFAAQHARLCMAAQCLRHGEPAPSQASLLLQGIDQEQLDVVQQAEVKRLLVAAARASGDRKGARSAASAYKDAVSALGIAATLL
jgi:hypothetical protein